jgi:thymidylate synthase
MMNTLDTQYKDLLRLILQHGVEKEDRTGTGTKSIFGYTIRHNMKEGFPLLTTKKMHFPSIASELCWFLQGRTDLRYLLAHNNHIWTGDAYTVYDKDFDAEHPPFSAPYPPRLTHKEFEEKIMTDDDFNQMYGDLGPIYGKQWRSWPTYSVRETTFKTGIYTAWRNEADQIANLINDLKTNPDSRRLMVNAWNVGEIDQMVLPPCHYGFQVYTRELSAQERLEWVKVNLPNIDVNGFVNNDEYSHKWVETLSNNIPKRAISLMWNQRSVDTFLGLPFNIASYGLLLEIIAKEVNMVPDELIGNLGDTHLYLNHIEQAKEQIGMELSLEERIELASKDPVFDPGDFGVGEQVTDEHCHKICDSYSVPRKTREPFALPKIKIESEVKWREGDCLPTYSPNDFTLLNYQSHPAIKAPLSN